MACKVLDLRRGISYFESDTEDGRKFRNGQNDNGMHWGEIVAPDGTIEAAATANTAAEVFTWKAGYINAPTA